MDEFTFVVAVILCLIPISIGILLIRNKAGVSVPRWFQKQNLFLRITWLVLAVLVYSYALFLILGYLTFLYRDKNAVSFKCPDSYTDSAQYDSDLQSYISSKVALDPNITTRQILEDRYDLLVANHCEATLVTLQRNTVFGLSSNKEDVIDQELRDSNESTTSAP